MQGVMEIANDADIITIQEPWIGDTCQTIDRTQCPQTICHVSYDILFKEAAGGVKVRVMWMVRKDPRAKVRIRDDLSDDPNASVMDVQIEGNRSLLHHQHTQPGAIRG